MDIKKLFLDLTEYTIPYGMEDTLEPLLPKGFKKDSVGNYYYEIGESETLFTAHLDTYCKKSVKVNHIIEGDIIKTDGKTILGGDNKAGCCVLINMILNKVPGTYFFFLGEEPILSGGRWGSRMALRANPSYFKKFKRAIAFDRKHFGSIITRQSARFCCSDEFAESLIEDFDKSGLIFKKDMTGWYTDTATFMDVIPEITNISVGGWGEHSKDEYINIKYLQYVCDAAVQVKWEQLPTVRLAKSNIPPRTKGKFTRYDRFLSTQTFKEVCEFLEYYGLTCLNSKDFSPNHPMIFSAWHQDVEFSVSFFQKNVILDGQSSSVEDFKEMVDPNWRETTKPVDE